MLRSRKKDANLKPNRKLDKRSSRGMLFENEELRMRTIEINAEVERGQCDLKKLRRENQRLRRDMWALREEYERLEERVGGAAGGGGSGSTLGPREYEGGRREGYDEEEEEEEGYEEDDEEEAENEENRHKAELRVRAEAADPPFPPGGTLEQLVREVNGGAGAPGEDEEGERGEEGAGHPPPGEEQLPPPPGIAAADAPLHPPEQQGSVPALTLLLEVLPGAQGGGPAPLRMGDLLGALGPARLDALVAVSLQPPGAMLELRTQEDLEALLRDPVHVGGRPCRLSALPPDPGGPRWGDEHPCLLLPPPRPAHCRSASAASRVSFDPQGSPTRGKKAEEALKRSVSLDPRGAPAPVLPFLPPHRRRGVHSKGGGSGVEADSEASTKGGTPHVGRHPPGEPRAGRRGEGQSAKELPWCGCWGNGCF